MNMDLLMDAKTVADAAATFLFSGVFRRCRRGRIRQSLMHFVGGVLLQILDTIILCFQRQRQERKRKTKTKTKRERARERGWCFVQNEVKGVKGFKFWFGCNGHECGWFGTEARAV